MEAYLVAIGTIAAIYVLLALGLTLQYGLTGLINFGHVGFFAIGAYTSALLALAGLPIPLSLAAAAVASAIVAWPIGLVALRLREDYFAVVTLGFGETVRLIITSERWLTNGVQGIPGIPRLFAADHSAVGAMATLLILGICCLGAALMLQRLARSPFGRMIEAIRDNEDARFAPSAKTPQHSRRAFSPSARPSPGWPVASTRTSSPIFPPTSSPPLSPSTSGWR